MITRLWTTGLVVVGACAGAALALQLITIDKTWQVLVAVVVAVLLSTVLVRSEERQPVPEPAPVAAQERRWPTHGDTTAVVPQRRAGETARVVLDVETPSAGGKWWTQTGTAPPRAASNGKAPRPTRDLAGYLDTARVVQCPRCGSFHIDVTQLAGGYSFRCRTDEHSWQWRPGQAWPSTVVVSRRRIP